MSWAISCLVNSYVLSIRQLHRHLLAFPELGDIEWLYDWHSDPHRSRDLFVETFVPIPTEQWVLILSPPIPSLDLRDSDMLGPINPRLHPRYEAPLLAHGLDLGAGAGAVGRGRGQRWRK